ncbi:MAG: hypothetical protein NTZ83_06425 [Candidatus Pacearchaeota archaeon]|nr:hypothetical protein [Candidatus Pacearchaeota archaeon]
MKERRIDRTNISIVVINDPKRISAKLECLEGLAVGDVLQTPKGVSKELVLEVDYRDYGINNCMRQKRLNSFTTIGRPEDGEMLSVCNIDKWLYLQLHDTRSLSFVNFVKCTGVEDITPGTFIRQKIGHYAECDKDPTLYHEYDKLLEEYNKSSENHKI